MVRNTSFSLSEHFTGFIEEQIQSGRYSSASDVVRAGLRLLEEDEARFRRLREAIDEGFASDPVEDFDWDEFRKGKLAEHREHHGE